MYTPSIRVLEEERNKLLTTATRLRSSIQAFALPGGMDSGLLHKMEIQEAEILEEEARIHGKAIQILHNHSI